MGAIETGETPGVTTVADNREASVLSVGGASILEVSSDRSISEKDRTGVVADSVKFERTTDGTRSFVTVDASGFDQLELSFKDECWVEISDNQFGLIYNDLNRPNDVLTIYGTAPFKVLLGKATGVEMIYNGRPFELEPFVSRDRTAKLTVSD